jgi:hypothetical protein
VRENVQRGEIEGRIIGGRWRFRRADLDAFMKTHPVAGTLSERVFTGLDGEQALIREKNIYKHLLITLGVS